MVLVSSGIPHAGSWIVIVAWISLGRCLLSDRIPGVLRGFPETSGGVVSVLTGIGAGWLGWPWRCGWTRSCGVGSGAGASACTGIGRSCSARSGRRRGRRIRGGGNGGWLSRITTALSRRCGCTSRWLIVCQGHDWQLDRQ